jgi:hypothetical protein
VWLTQAQLVEIYQSSKSNISEHLANIFADKELDKEIRSVVWNTTREHHPRVAHKSRHWSAIAAAACLAAVIIPMVLLLHVHQSDLERVNIEGEHFYFACNNGCTPESTLETFKTMIR